MRAKPDVRAVLRIAALALASIGSLSSAGAAAQAPDLDWLDRDALEAREIVVRTRREDGSITVDTAALIAASSTDIWDILTACEVAPEYVPNVVSCERIERLDDGRAELFVQTIKPIFFMPRFEHVFRLDYAPYERIDVTRVSGPIAHLQGSWWLLPQPESGVLLLHRLEVNPGMPIPRFMLRATMRRDLSKIMEAVRERAEARAAGGGKG